jgi:hypothetical protein
VILEFKKARLRVPTTKDQFESRIIQFDGGEWTSDGARPVKFGGAGAMLEENVRRAIIGAYDRLASAVETTGGVRKVSVEALRDEVKSNGFLENKDTGGLTGASRMLFHRAKTGLITSDKFTEEDEMIWRPIIIVNQ